MKMSDKEIHMVVIKCKEEFVTADGRKKKKKFTTLALSVPMCRKPNVTQGAVKILFYGVSCFFFK